MKKWRKLWECFPPGYEYERERNMAWLLLGAAMALSLQYFVKLYDASETLYYVDRIRGKVVRPDMQAESFLHLTFGYGGLFLPFFLFLAAMMVYHYFYYYRDTKSIYLMKRIPRRGVLMRSCVQAPLWGMAAGAAAIAVLCLLYYGAYLLVIPAECGPRFL